MGTRVVRIDEMLFDLEWSVLCAFRTAWVWTHKVGGGYVYTPRYVIYMIYTLRMTCVFCHEFGVPVRPTQNCAYMIVLDLHVILFTVF